MEIESSEIACIAVILDDAKRNPSELWLFRRIRHIAGDLCTTASDPKYTDGSKKAILHQHA